MLGREWSAGGARALPAPALSEHVPPASVPAVESAAPLCRSAGPPLCKPTPPPPRHGFRLPTRVPRLLTGLFLALSVLAQAPLTRAQSRAARALEYPPKTQLPEERPTTQAAQAHLEMTRIPPLNDLIDLARERSPQQAFLDKAIAVERERLKIHKWADFKPLSVNADAFRGNLDVFTVNSDGDVLRPSAAVQDRTNYQAAVTLRLLPANLFVNKANRRIAELEAERIGLLAEQTAMNTAGEIAYLHGQVTKALELMDLFAESAEIARTNAQMGERLFRDGAMTLADYSAVSSAAVESSAKFDNARGEFRLYFQMLMIKVYGRVP